MSGEKLVIMAVNCDANNYANLFNGVNIKNVLTCSFTWLYLESENELRTGDQSTIPDGETIDTIDITITDGTTTVMVSSGTPTPIVIDVSTLDNTLTWRIDYAVLTTPGAESCSVPLFIEPFVPEIITGTSDPNQTPLPLTTLLPSVASPHPVQIYEQDFPSSTTWSVTHNHGFADPLSIQVYNSVGDTLTVGRSNITANSFDIVFFTARAGTVKVISKV